MKKITVLAVLKYAFMTAILALTLFPLIYIFFASFKSNMEILTEGATLLPKTFDVSNYVLAWEKANFKVFTWNSIYMCFFIVSGTILTSTMAGYVFARSDFPGNRIIFAILTATMFISAGVLFLYPQIKIARMLHIHTSLWGVIIIRIFGINITQLYLARSYIRTISTELDDAAKIDGCSFFRIYWSIIFPLIKPLVATVGLLSFMNAWNDYLLPLVFTLGNPKNAPLIVGVVNLRAQGEAASAWNLMLAGTMISTIPMIVVYLLLNRFFVSGLTSGAIKG